MGLSAAASDYCYLELEIVAYPQTRLSLNGNDDHFHSAWDRHVINGAACPYTRP
jgi:hypothetical protein